MAPTNMAKSKTVNNVVSTSSKGEDVPNTKLFMSRKFSRAGEFVESVRHAALAGALVCNRGSFRL